VLFLTAVFRARMVDFEMQEFLFTGFSLQSQNRCIPQPAILNLHEHRYAPGISQTEELNYKNKLCIKNE